MRNVPKTYHRNAATRGIVGRCEYADHDIDMTSHVSQPCSALLDRSCLSGVYPKVDPSRFGSSGQVVLTSFEFSDFFCIFFGRKFPNVRAVCRSLTVLLGTQHGEPTVVMIQYSCCRVFFVSEVSMCFGKSTLDRLRVGYPYRLLERRRVPDLYAQK